MKVELPAHLAESCDILPTDWSLALGSLSNDMVRDTVRENCPLLKDHAEDTLVTTKLRNDTWMVGQFKQPPVPALDGLESAGLQDEPCQDGDLTTPCARACDGVESTTACEGQEVVLEEPMMLMSVMLGSLHLYADGEENFDVLAYDGSRWNTCTKTQVWIAKQWTKVHCVSTLYAEKIKIVGATREIHEIHPTGMRLSTLFATRSQTGTQLEQSVCVHKDT